MPILLILIVMGVSVYILRVQIKKSEDRLTARVLFAQEWFLLKLLLMNKPEKFEHQTYSDGLPVSYWWVRTHYELNSTEDEFFSDIQSESTFPDVDYEELIEARQRYLKNFSKTQINQTQSRKP